MKQICFFLLFLILMSCEYFNVKKTSSEAILQEELQLFNWNEVDEYPSFSVCDSIETKLHKKQCFETVLTEYITNYFQQDTIIVSQDISDTLLLHLQISDKGILTLVDVEVDSLTNKEIPDIADLLKKGLDALPLIYPALKRGQQVKTEFKLPVIIHVD